MIGLLWYALISLVCALVVMGMGCPGIACETANVIKVNLRCPYIARGHRCDADPESGSDGLTNCISAHRRHCSV